MDKKDVRDRAIVKIWERNLKKARENPSRERFTKDAKEIGAFYQGPHDDVFQQLRDWYPFDESAQVTVNKTAQYVRVYGPTLYNHNPVRTVSPKRDDVFSRVLADVQADYGNYTPEETNLRREGRLYVDESLISGLGLLAPGINPDTGLIESRFVSPAHFQCDPDVERFEDCKWMALRRRMPLWEAQDLYGKRAAGLKADSAGKSRDAGKETGAGPEDIDAKTKTSGEVNDLVTIWEIYSKMGVGFRAKNVEEFDEDGSIEDEDKEEDDSQDYKYLVLALGHDKPLHIGKWPVPFYLDGDFPFTFLFYLSKPRELYPIAPLKPALGIQKAIDVLATFLIEKAKTHSKEIIGCDEDVFDEVYQLLIEGSDCPVVPFRRQMDGRGLKEKLDWIQPPPMGTDLRTALEMLERLFEEQTGLSEVLMGLHEKAFRSAEEAKMKDRNSRITVEDMADEVEYALTRAARKEALMALWLMNGDDIEKVVGRKTYAWKIEISYMGKPMKWSNALQESIPEATDYYDSREDAVAGGQVVGTRTPAPEVDPFWRVDVVPVTAKVVWNDARALMSKEDIAREYHYRIESGSARRRDKNWEIDIARFFMDNIAKTAYELGDVPAAHKALDYFYDSIGVAKHRRVYPEPPPPPPEAMAPAPPGIA